jgi:hypothetical protein
LLAGQQHGRTIPLGDNQALVDFTALTLGVADFDLR